MSSEDMNSLWDTWRGRRNFSYFFVGLAGFVTLFIVGAVIHHFGLEKYIVPALPCLGVLFVVWFAQGIRRERARRRERLRRAPLSRDELRVARSKLMQYRKAKGL